MMLEAAEFAGNAAGGILSAIGERLARTLGNHWKRVQWEFAEDQYRTRVRQSLLGTRLLGAADDIDIEDLFTEVYFLPDASSTRRYTASSFSASHFGDFLERREKERFSAIQAVEDCPRLYILGTPGAGKTTFLKHVAVLTAKGSLPGLPIFISLKDWADSGSDFLDYAAHEFDICGFADARPVIEAILDNGEATLLLDGLDEVVHREGRRSRVIKAIAEIVRKYPKSRVLLTCRTSASEHSFSSFRYVELAEFGYKQQGTFVQNWFRSQPTKSKLFLEQFALDENASLRDLGRKPLFLALLCIAFDQTLEFPSTKSALHSEAIDALLTKWDASRSIQRETYGLSGVQRKRLFLAQLAQRTFELDQYAFKDILLEALLRKFIAKLPKHDRHEEVDGPTLLRSLEAAHGLIVERAVGTFSFSHLSIHEYFAAAGIVNGSASGTPWSRLLPSGAVLTNRWREVILHISSMLHDADKFTDYIEAEIAKFLEQEQSLRMLLEGVAYIAATDPLFQEFSTGPVRFLHQQKENASFGSQTFYPSDALSSSVARLERTLLFSIKRYRDQQLPMAASLATVWRRTEVLRETLSYKHGLSLVIPPVIDLASFDSKLIAFIASQDLLLVLLEDALMTDRERLRRRIMGADWH